MHLIPFGPCQLLIPNHKLKSA